MIERNLILVAEAGDASGHPFEELATAVLGEHVLLEGADAEVLSIRYALPDGWHVHSCGSGELIEDPDPVRGALALAKG